MLKDLYKYLKRPALYERTTTKFWNDPHIAKSMLASHLEPDTNGASREFEFMDRSVEWILSLPLPENARLLDIGCGPGLYTMRFAERGLYSTGLDFSENSINYAREHDPKSEYILQDYLAMDFENAYDIITLISYDYAALIPDERHNLLARVYRALKPGGLFLFDVMTPIYDKGKTDRTYWEMYPNGGFMSSKPYMVLNADNYYGDVAAGARIVLIEEDDVRCWNLWFCYFTKQSLLDEVKPFGFTEFGFYEDVAGKPYTEDSQSICAILKK
ncbi:MAG: class I SAM-dependent methyltransferase [Oscillospiraceae bacterium]|nr:class I SAM-dependent methyltransferase [Oscillospiraceae bacterium]